MLEEILRTCNNWFLVPYGIHTGTFSVEGGSIALPFLAEGQYFRVVGSVFNDGVYQYPPSVVELVDETFDGAIWALAIPKSVVDLAERVQEWNEKYQATATGPYQSESFGGYSYSRATDPKTGGAVTWKTAFADELSRLRKIGNPAKTVPKQSTTWYRRPYNPDYPWR